LFEKKESDCGITVTIAHGCVRAGVCIIKNNVHPGTVRKNDNICIWHTHFTYTINVNSGSVPREMSTSWHYRL